MERISGRQGKENGGAVVGSREEIYTAHGTQVFLDEGGFLCHAGSAGNGRIPVFAHRAEKQIFLFAAKGEENFRYIREIHGNGHVALSDFPVPFPAFFQEDGRVSIGGNGVFASARKEGTIALVPRNLAWEQFVLGKASFLEADISVIRGSSLFDGTWYRAHYRLGGETDPAEHYLAIGGKRGYYPSEKFSGMSYCSLEDSVLKNDENPLLHYERSKRKQRVFSYYDDIETIRDSLFFDEAWYRKTYRLPREEDAARHYLERKDPPTVQSASSYFYNKAMEIRLGIPKQIVPLLYVERRKSIYGFLEDTIRYMFLR